MCQAGGGAARIFAIVEYRFCGEGRAPVPIIPSWCPLGVLEGACDLRVHSYRERKTGPGHPLAVVSCSAHETGFFTLYPLGHVPYGRQPLVQRHEAGERRWRGTPFRAAIDAACGERWSTQSPADDPRRRRTQGRHLEIAELLVGTHPRLTETQRAWVIDDLRAPQLAVVEASTASWTSRARAVVAALGVMSRANSQVERLLAAGFSAGLWPVPYIWSYGWRSPVPEHRRAGHDRSRAPPPTNSRGDG